MIIKYTELGKRLLAVMFVAVSITTLVAPSLLVAANSPNAMTTNELRALSLYPNWIASAPTCGSGGGTTSANLVGNDNTQKAFNYFLTQRKLSVTQTAAVVGNLMDESGLDPTILQRGGNSLNPNDAGTSGPDGWGIAQWSPGGKITDIAKTYGITGNIDLLATQLDIVWAEMSGPKAVTPVGYKDLAHDPVFSSPSSTLSALVTDFQVHFEGGIPGARQQDAIQALAKYGGGAAAVANSGSTTGSNCSVSAAICTPSGSSSTAPTPTTSTLSPVRQSVVCMAQAELALWKQQPGYTNPYPGFKYAATGMLKYTDNTYEEWCADFASWLYKQSGYPFTGGSSGGWRLPGVPGIVAIGQANTKFHWHPQSSGYTPKPGDLTIHSNYSHVNIFISSNAGVSTYIGGDERGVNEPSGTFGTKNPPSGSIISQDTSSGYYGSDIIGYVSPD